MGLLPAGIIAPNLELPDLAGEARELVPNAAEPVLLAFFKVNCPTCQLALPFLERSHQGSDGRLRVLAVSQDSSDATSRFRKSFGITMPTLIDDDESGYEASNAYGLTHVPSLFLIEPDGRVSWSGDGFARADFARIGERFGADPFLPGEYVPEWKAG